MNRLLPYSDLELLTCLVVGEAANQPWAGKVGVAYTAYVRTQHPGHWHWGHNWREVILCKNQFSCFFDHNLNRIIEQREQHSAIWQECYMVAYSVYLELVSSYIGEPTHYHTLSVQPYWANDLRYLMTIGDHKFYTCF